MLLMRGQQTHLPFYLERKGRVGKTLHADAQMAKRSVRWIYADSLRRVKSGARLSPRELEWALQWPTPHGVLTGPAWATTLPDLPGCLPETLTK